MRKMRLYSKSARRSQRKALRHLRWYINKILQERPR